MKLIIKNIGKIELADMRLDGITVICGENNTGKSTVGKVLFSYFNAMCNFEQKIQEERFDKCINCFHRYSYGINYQLIENIRKFLYSITDISLNDVKSFINQYDIKNKKDLAEEIYSIINMNNEEKYFIKF